MKETHHTHTFQNYIVRTIQQEDGLIWFVNADICNVLGCSDSRDAIRNLDPNEKNVIEGREFNDNNELLLSIISESGLYKLIHQSSNPEAKDFSKWITTTIIHQIRKGPEKEHLIIPYVHTPDSFDLACHTLADGTTEYRSPLSHNQVKVETKPLSFMMKSSIEKFKVMLDILSEEDYQKFGHAFMSMIRDTSATMEEAIHYIEQNIGEIQVSVIGHNQFPYKAGAVINAKLEGGNHGHFTGMSDM